MKGILVVNAPRCLGCKSCELACAVEHSQSGSLFEAVFESPAPSSRVDVVKGERYAVPLQCRQCEDAPCAAVCPTDALTRTDQDSPVLVNQERCIGCKWCVLACPFGVISINSESRAVIKCDQCFERVERGEMPACVSACPTSALQYKSLSDVVTKKREAFLVQIENSLSGGEK